MACMMDNIKSQVIKEQNAVANQPRWQRDRLCPGYQNNVSLSCNVLLHYTNNCTSLIPGT